MTQHESAAQHTPEPWSYSVEGNHLYLRDASGNVFARTLDVSDNGGLRNNFRRIIACVNACAGLATDQLEKLALIQSDEGVAGLGCMAVALKVTRDRLDEVGGALQAIMDDSMSDVRKSLYAGAKDALEKLAKLPK